MTEQAKTITVTCPKCGEEIDVTDIERKIQGKKRIEETEQHIERLKTEIELIEKKIKANKKYIAVIQQAIDTFSSTENNPARAANICAKREYLKVAECEREKRQKMLQYLKKEEQYLEKLIKELKENGKEN